MSGDFGFGATTSAVRIRIRRRQRHSQISNPNPSDHISPNSTQTPLHNSDYIDFDDEGLFNSILDRIAHQHHEQHRTTQLPATSRSLISSIPIVEITGSLLKSGSISCSICKDEYAINEKVNQLPCKHIFHHECIVPWLNRSNSCPLCRYKLPVERRPEQLMNNVVRLENSHAEGRSEDRESGFSVQLSQGGSRPRMIRVIRRYSSLSSMGQAVTGSAAPANSGSANGNVNVMLDEDGDTVMLDS
uniref:RING-type E3 ubiquitin transferase n=1 Tax=Davidia involucrata TaxID=16924 RepID=A0A5B6YTZ6_DAVIN